MPETNDTGKARPQTGPTKPGDNPRTDHRDHEDKRPRNPERDRDKPRDE